MSGLFHDENLGGLWVEAKVVDFAPGRIALSRSPFYPGGGGQPADRGMIRWNGGEAAVTGFAVEGGQLWHLLDTNAELHGTVNAAVDPRFRRTMQQLHTGLHILNALVYQAFDGALVTGVQIYGDGTARMDFDVPGADNDRLRQLEAAVNEVIIRDLPVSTSHVPIELAQAEHGLIRSKSVAPPPTPDGRIRIVDIAGLDRQACGGTHLSSTGGSPPIRLLKIENKGRHNRRIRIGLEGR
jgi:misacylated tRNA(Ala) deacylase